jgi:predicted ATPase
MFDCIKIEGFRSFKKVELEMPRLAVLIGPNGGGKSNFVDLLMLMAEAGNGELAVGVNKRGGFRNIAFGFEPTGEVLVEFSFKGLRDPASEMEPLPPLITLAKKPFDITYRVTLRGLGVNFRVWEEQLHQVSVDPEQITFEIDRDATRTLFKWRIISQEGEEPKSVEDVELAISQVKDANKFRPPYAVFQELRQWAFYRDIDVGPESPVRQPVLIRPATRLLSDGTNLSSVFFTIQQEHPDDWDDILGILKTAYPDFVKLTVPAGGGDGKVHLRWFERPNEKQGLSANLLSDGTLKLLCLVAILKSPNPPPLICIDEPELGLHPDWIELVAELMQDAAARTQVIVATHSPHIVAKLDPDQVIVTEKENGETRLDRLSAKDLEKWLRDFNLADLWLAGHIGGRP